MSWLSCLRYAGWRILPSHYGARSLSMLIALSVILSVCFWLIVSRCLHPSISFPLHNTDYTLHGFRRRRSGHFKVRKTFPKRTILFGLISVSNNLGTCKSHNIGQGVDLRTFLNFNVNTANISNLCVYPTRNHKFTVFCKGLLPHQVRQ